MEQNLRKISGLFFIGSLAAYLLTFPNHFLLSVFEYLLLGVFFLCACISISGSLLFSSRWQDPSFRFGVGCAWISAFCLVLFYWMLGQHLSLSFYEKTLFKDPFFFLLIASALLLPCIFTCGMMTAFFQKYRIAGLMLAVFYLILLFFFFIFMLAGQSVYPLNNLLFPGLLVIGLLIWFLLDLPELIDESIACPSCHTTVAGSMRCPFCGHSLSNSAERIALLFPNEPVFWLNVLCFSVPIVGFIYTFLFRKRASICAKKMLFWSLVGILPGNMQIFICTII